MTRAHTTTFEHTIDWNDYWTDADEDDREGAGPSAQYVRDPLVAFLDERGPPASYADVGCGPGDLAFAIAREYPEATVRGYDAAEPVLDANRERARERDVQHLAFERAVLPEFDPDRRFELVSCFYTLCYVENVDRALERLYDAVEPGGALALGYHNRLARAHFRRIAAAPDEYLDESSPWDPGRFADRFELLLAGENLLSYDRIHDALGTWPRSLYAVAEDVEPHRARRHNPFVYVPKPGRTDR